jgi:nucleotide-binding universal stress UspA family protein
MAKESGSKVWILNIVERHFDDFNPADKLIYGVQYLSLKDIRENELKKEYKKVREFSARLTAEGIPSESLLIEGPTAKMIMDEALKLQIDFLIISSHKQNFLYHSVKDSITSSVIKQSNIPLLVVPE